MNLSTEIKIATRDGIKVDGLEVRSVGRQTRFVLTRHADGLASNGLTDWAITHAKTGRAVTSQIPQIMPPTIANLSAVIRAWDKLDVDWSVIDDLGHGENVPLKDHAAKARALVVSQKLRQAASDVYAARYIKPGRL